MTTTVPSLEIRNFTLLAHSDLGGRGDTMQFALHGSTLYVGHGKGDRLDVLDVSDPRVPRIVNRLASPHPDVAMRKVQVVGDVMAVNMEVSRGANPAVRGGVRLFDLTDPQAPRLIGDILTAGRGVHRLSFRDPQRAYLSGWYEGYSGRILIMFDVSDPARPRELGHWGLPGQWTAAGETPTWPDTLTYQLHHGIADGDVVYCGWWDGGLVVLDIAAPAVPHLLAHVTWAPSEGGTTHTALPLPGRSLLVTTDEAVKDGGKEPPKRVRLFDVHDPASPSLLSVIPLPEGDYASHGLRYGAHNLHENNPGTRVSEQEITVTYFSAGLRVYDIANPVWPREVAAFVPPPPDDQACIQLNDVLVGADHRVYVGDRFGGGLYVLERQ